ncbi:4Fe-4S dicluster domain-containing protein [Labrys wisconsinensis]|uniref:NAD-dependent dihydropyrimidine dehydrogenase PreA subunit n=1 Tax=Labrys wisconsinensis TaxID=425677 RepID=A0ABU0JJJ8_9HYPH|nr:ferredoxin family protein [Labrys wisconsinensis]MDQ0474458.1 NAD-dependent dihydropyrimidine dehydrogenase PreA subunit [Labrys wisconsinensis]
MIELVSAARCIRCDSCVDACPDHVFDAVPGGVPVIARLDDCQTCFLCELYCPVDALYVSPLKDDREKVDEAALIASGTLGSYRRALGWRGIKAAGTEGDLSHRLFEPDGTPHAASAALFAGGEP